MPAYRTVAQTAQKLNVPETLLSDFIASGWLSAVDKNGLTFMAVHQEYKARFILFLREQRQLSDEQIARVLAEQEPPYSLEAVDAILAHA